MGPSFDMIMRRTKFASVDLIKEATKIPSGSTARKVKNISTDEFAKKGLIHMERQELSTLQSKKVKGLKEKRKRDEPLQDQNKKTKVEMKV